jgi:hypothetical protein
MKKFVLASGNKGKVREINEILAEVDIEVVPQSEFGVPEADETGLTFVENAILKARNAARSSGNSRRSLPMIRALKWTTSRARRGSTQLVMRALAPVTRQTCRS